MKTALILMAAGHSSRMGSPKQLLNYKGKSLLRHAAESAKESNADYLLLVTGAYHEPLINEVSGLGFEITRNLAWESGLASSIKAGVEKIEALFKDVSVLTVMLSDQPLVTANHLENLCGLLKEHEEVQIAASSYNGKPGVPAAFRKGLFEKMKNLTGDKGAQQLFIEIQDKLELITSDTLLSDIDSPADYDALLRNFNA